MEVVKNDIIYTELTECRDCYKCVRHCPVKSIQVKGHEATVVGESCIHCAHCVEICPNHAKKIRNDLSDCQQMVKDHDVIALVAPSILAEFPGISMGQISATLQKLGFTGVSEVAHGAYIYSKFVEDFLKGAATGVYLSSCCPVAIKYILSKHEYLGSNIVPIRSPLQLHIQYLKKEVSSKVKFVFVGPCPGKKNEADLYEDLSLSITYQDLHQWCKEEEIISSELPEKSVICSPVGQSHHYATISGMFKTISEMNDCDFITVSGLENLGSVFHEFEHVDKKVFVEILACAGGCIEGPSTNKKISQTKKIVEILKRPAVDAIDVDMKGIDSQIKIPVIKKLMDVHSRDMERALAKVGKYNVEDELNCGGCGYDSCRHFATALAQGLAEESMCVSYMRKLASNKAIRLMNSMPNAAVIVNANLDIVECNKPFAAIAGKEYEDIYNVAETLSGITLKKIFPFTPLFIQALEQREDYEGVQIIGGKTLKVTIFPIEENQFVGAVIQDITRPVGERKQIIEKTQDVIQKNLQTVQQIAYLLGENAAETEMILNSIVEAFRDRDE